MKRLSPDRWMDAMVSGDLTMKPAIVGFTTVGQPVSPWGVVDRELPLHVLYLLVHGALRVRTRDRRGRAGVWQRVGAGQALWLAPGVRHDLDQAVAHEPFTLYFARLDCRLHGAPCRLAPDALIVTPAREARRWLALLDDERSPGEAGYPAARTRGVSLLLAAAMLDAARVGHAHGVATGLSAAQRAAVQQVVSITLRRGGRLIPAELAAAAGLAPGYFAKRFKVTFGMPPRAWLVAQRLRAAAADLIEHGGSISEVAQKHGYDELYLFSRQFTALYGCSPRAFRHRHAGGSRINAAPSRPSRAAR